MGAELIIASVTILPGTITAVITAYVGLKRLKMIGHAVNGEMTAKFDKLHVRLDDIGEDVRDLKAEHREVKAELREYRSQLAGDGK
jgi:hypothetical protein